MDLLWILIILVLLLAAYVWSTWTFKHFEKLNIPYEKPLPFIGTLLPFFLRSKTLGEVVEEYYNKNKGSSIMGFFLFRIPGMILLDPELIRLITVKDFDHFTDHFSALSENDDPILGKFIFSLKGDRWRFMRNTLSPAFSSSNMKRMFHLAAECGTQLGDFLEKKCKDNGGLVTTDMKDLFNRFGNDVIATCAFGIKCDSLNEPENEFYMIGKRTVSLDGRPQMFKMFGYVLFPSLMRFFNVQITPREDYNFFYKIVQKSIDEREKGNIERPDMIQLLMEARKALKDSGDSEVHKDYGKHGTSKTILSDADITAQAFLFFLAGFETTSINLSFISHLLATHPEVLKKVQDEIDKVLKDGDGKLTYEGLNNMKYTDMVINETLRIWPPAVVAERVCVKPYTLPATMMSPSVPVKVGVTLNIPILPLHRDPEHFENPMEFKPERFSEENKHKIKPFTFLPFGAGPRNCIGIKFAMMETKIALASILSRFDLKVVPETPKKLVYTKDSMVISVVGGFWLGLSPRASRH